MSPSTSLESTVGMQEPPSQPVPNGNGLGLESSQFLSGVRSHPRSHQQIGDIQIPNGVPMHAATWENGQPNYVTDRRPAQHAANNIAGERNIAGQQS